VDEASNPLALLELGNVFADLFHHAGVVAPYKGARAGHSVDVLPVLVASN
jgi:hypothetical protein